MIFYIMPAILIIFIKKNVMELFRLNKIAIYFIALLTTIVYSCGSEIKDSDKPKVETVQELHKPIESDIKPQKRDIQYLAKNGYVTVTGKGLNTYAKMELRVLNKSKFDLEIIIPAGTFFDNPVNESQDLILLENYPVDLSAGMEKTIEVSTACTNANWSVPGADENWPMVPAPKNLGLALDFYGKHENSLNSYLAKKNPEKLGTEEGRKRFKQVVIWYYMGNDYAAIKNMLVQNVFHNDVASAELFLNSVQNEAQNIATLIRNRDSTGLKSLIKNASKSSIDRGINGLRKLRQKLD